MYQETVIKLQANCSEDNPMYEIRVNTVHFANYSPKYKDYIVLAGFLQVTAYHMRYILNKCALLSRWYGDGKLDTSQIFILKHDGGC